MLLCSHQSGIAAIDRKRCSATAFGPLSTQGKNSTTSSMSRARLSKFISCVKRALLRWPRRDNSPRGATSRSQMTWSDRIAGAISREAWKRRSEGGASAVVLLYRLRLVEALAPSDHSGGSSSRKLLFPRRFPGARSSGTQRWEQRSRRRADPSTARPRRRFPDSTALPSPPGPRCPASPRSGPRP